MPRWDPACAARHVFRGHYSAFPAELVMAQSLLWLVQALWTMADATGCAGESVKRQTIATGCREKIKKGA
jgi:hypothetical protein